MRLRIKVLLFTSIILIFLVYYINWLNTGLDVENFLKKRHVVMPWDEYAIIDIMRHVNFTELGIQDVKVYYVSIKLFNRVPPSDYSYVVVDEEGNMYKMPDDWNIFIKNYDIVLRSEEDVMNTLNTYLTLSMFLSLPWKIMVLSRSG